MNDPSQPTSTPPPPPPGYAPQPVQPGAPPPKKGLSPLAWIGIGCGVLAVLAMIVIGGLLAAGGWFIKKQADKFEKNPSLAAAELIVRANPELEVVSTDQGAGTITIRNKKTGEVVTFDAKDAENGHFKFKTKDGTATLDASGKDATIKVTDDKGQVSTIMGGGGTPQNLPSWLPVYPGATVQGVFDAKSAEGGRTLSFTVATTDAADKVLDFYKSRFEEAGLKVDSTVNASGSEGTGGLLTVNGENPSRSASVLVSSSGGQTQAVVNAQEK
jgi:hypothetical protein